MRAGVIVALAGLLGAIAATPARSAGTLADYPDMKSAFIGTAHVSVWLPDGYAAGKTRYAVLYMQDGQNLFDSASNRLGWPAHEPWGVDSAIAALDGAIRPVIVVAVDHMGVRRARQYIPRAVFDRLPEADRRLLEAEYGGVPFSDDYLRFLVKELKPFIDRTYRTDPDRDATFVMGSSMGGLISLYAVAEYPDVFAGAACLSTHWPLAVPGQETPGESVVEDAFESYLRAKLTKGHRLWFDHGTEGLDAGYGRLQGHIDQVLLLLHWQPGADFASATYVNASHDETAWRKRLADPLVFLLGPAGG